MLSGTIVIAYDRTHSLNDSICRHIQECLKFVVHAQDHDISCRIHAEYGVECACEQRRQCHIEYGRYTYGIELLHHQTALMQMLYAELHIYRSSKVHNKINDQCKHLSQASCQCSAFYTHFRKWSHTEYQQRIKHYIHNAAAHQSNHCNYHASNRLEHLLKCKINRNNYRKSKYNVCITTAKVKDVSTCLEGSEKRWNDGNTHDCHHYSLYNSKKHPPTSCTICPLIVLGSKIYGYHRVYSNTKSDRHSIYKILQWKYIRKCCHRILTYLRHKETVNYIVQSIHHHRYNHRQCHGHQKWEHRLFFHKILVHKTSVPGWHK